MPPKTKPIITPVINSTNLQKAKVDVLKDPVYGSDFVLLQNILKRYPYNRDVNIVAMKCALIDMTHTTHLSQQKKKLNLSKLVNTIISIQDFDIRVKAGDISLVNDVIKKCDVNITSFVSKYCQCHNNLIYGRDDYSKFDGVMCKVLPIYLNKVGMKTSKGTKISASYLRNLKNDYKQYDAYINDLLKKITLTNKKALFDLMVWYNNR